MTPWSWCVPRPASRQDFRQTSGGTILAGHLADNRSHDPLVMVCPASRVPPGLLGNSWRDTCPTDDLMTPWSWCVPRPASRQDFRQTSGGTILAGHLADNRSHDPLVMVCPASRVPPGLLGNSWRDTCPTDDLMTPWSWCVPRPASRQDFRESPGGTPDDRAIA